MGLTGSVVFLLWMLACRLAGDRLNARWRYAALKAALLFFLVPVGPCLRSLCTAARRFTTPTAPSLAVLPPTPAGTEAAPLYSAEPVPISPELGQLLLLIWVLGMAAVLARESLVFQKFQRHLRQAGFQDAPPAVQILLLACQQQLRVLRSIRLRVSPAAPTPFVMGLLRPTLVLPARAYASRELRCILLHELTHLKQGDLWVRRVSLLAAAVHWWNPLVHLLGRSLAELGEESCDERVAAPLSPGERQDYSRALLDAACTAPMPEGWTLPLSKAKTIQRRLSKMLHVKKLTRRQKVLSLCAVLALLACGAATALAVQSPVAVRDEPATDDLSAQDQEPVQPVSSPPEETEPAGPPEETAEPPAEGTDTPPAGEPSAPSVENSSEGGDQSAPVISAAEPDEPSQPAAESPADNELPDESWRTNANLPSPYDSPEELALLVNTPERQVSAACRDENWNLRYVVYSDGTRANSPAFQRVIDAVIEEANQQGLLVDGQFHRNSKGETYGSTGIGSFGAITILGELPDLIAAIGIHGERGYFRQSELVDAATPTYSAEECPHEFLIPLYDCEGNVIGEFAVKCGGHISVVGKTIEEVRREIAGENADVFISEKTMISTP